MDGVRAAAGFEGLIVLGVIYFILNVISEAAKKKGKSTVAPSEAPAEPSPTQQEALSLERILAEIERVKKAGPPAAERGPAPVGTRSVPPPRPRPTQAPRAPLPPRRPGPAPRQSKPVGDPHRGPLGRSPDRAISATVIGRLRAASGLARPRERTIESEATSRRASIEHLRTKSG